MNILKLGFSVLSLNLLIVLVAYGTEARKIVEGNLQAKKLNFSDDQVRISSYGDLQNTDDTQFFWKYNNREDNKKENARIGISSYGHLHNKDDAQNFWLYNSQEDNKKENSQVRLSSYGDLQNMDDTQNSWICNNQEDNKNENSQVRISSYRNLQNKDDTQNFWIYNNQEDNKKENSQVRLSSYGNLQNKGDTQNFWIYNNQGDDKKAIAQGENKHQQAKTTHIHSSTHMDHIDASLRVFFLIDDLKQGEKITVSFPRRDLSSSPSFLPREEADSIPFSLKELPNLLQRFSFSRHSPQAKAIQDTLRVCEIPPIKGETKYCATSSEAMLDFVQKIIGEKIQFKALSTTHFSNSTPHLQKYTILNAPQEITTPKMVACHTMPYPYTVFYCHYTISKSRVFKVSLNGENGDKVEAVAVCHLDTSNWNPSHVSFKVLGILPGTSPICHFFPSDNLLWVSKIATAQVS